jgi:hypothetical protein
VFYTFIIRRQLAMWSFNHIPEVQKLPDSVRSEMIADAEGRHADKLLAQELNAMSIQERESVYETIHGVDQVAEETAEVLEQSLKDFAEELSKIPEKKAYDLANHLHQDYVTSQSFRLMFLRADRFDARAAARRMVRFMEHRMQWFGPETLGRPLLLSDLSKQDMDALRSGMFQILPARDTSVRLVYLDFQRIIPHRGSWQNYVRKHANAVLPFPK